MNRCGRSISTLSAAQLPATVKKAPIATASDMMLLDRLVNGLLVLNLDNWNLFVIWFLVLGIFKKLTTINILNFRQFRHFSAL